MNDEGHLNFADTASSPANSSRWGVSYKFPDGSYRDATSPGCFCEGWGVSAGAVSGYANVATDGVVNLSLSSFVSAASTATSVVTLTSLPELRVTQAYSPSAAPEALFVNHVTIANTGATDLTDVRYVRVMDWDVPLTEFSEFVTIKGTATTTLLEFSNDQGFASANPLGGDPGEIVAGTTDTDFTDSGPADHGAFFRFNFGTIAAGESYSFDIFYGATASESSALAALGIIGAELFSLGQSSPPSGDPTLGTPATYIFAFKGVGGDIIVPPPSAVPEPATFLLLGGGVAAMALVRRRMKASA